MRYSRILVSFILIILMAGSLAAGHRRAFTPPGSRETPIVDALGIGAVSGAAGSGTVASVQGTIITLNSGAATSIRIDAANAKFVGAEKDSSSSLTINDVKPGARLTAFITLSG